MVWDYKKGGFRVQFDDLPVNVDIKIRLLNWYNDLSNNEGTKNNISLECLSLSSFKLNDGYSVPSGKMFILSVWNGIYSKWEEADKDINLDVYSPVDIKLMKHNKRKWRIYTIQKSRDTR